MGLGLAMSATILYQPVKGKSLSIGAPSSFLALLERVFGGSARDFVLAEDDVGGLRTAAAATEDREYRKALEELAEAVEKHGAVRVWAVY